MPLRCPRATGSSGITSSGESLIFLPSTSISSMPRCEPSTMPVLFRLAIRTRSPRMQVRHDGRRAALLFRLAGLQLPRKRLDLRAPFSSPQPAPAPQRGKVPGASAGARKDFSRLCLVPLILPPGLLPCAACSAASPRPAPVCAAASSCSRACRSDASRRESSSTCSSSVSSLTSSSLSRARARSNHLVRERRAGPPCPARSSCPACPASAGTWA